jgi:hypothetical protein
MQMPLCSVLVALSLLVQAVATATAKDGEIDAVYVVFSTHLDLGYDAPPDGEPSGNPQGAKTSDVINRYFDTYFGQVAKTAAEIRATSEYDYKWMTQAWLVSAYRHCKDTNIGLNCPNATALKHFEESVRRGEITWHAFPFNAEPELFDATLFGAALNLTFDEDEFYGHAKRMTYSQRDVPGLTRATVPIFSKAGVKAVSVGENNAASPVNLPPIFVWRDIESDSEVLALFHSGGYGGDSNSTIDKLQTNLTNVSQEDCVRVPEARVALCYAWREDNTGPHLPNEVMQVFGEVKQTFPNAKLHSSDSFDDFVEKVWPVRSNLPVVTAEIGDTWIYGASTDPLKLAQFRAINRARAQCSADGIDASTDTKSIGKQTKQVSPPGLRGAKHATLDSEHPSMQHGAFLPWCECTVRELKNFERLLMLAGEHTFGSDGGQTRNEAWSKEELQQKLDEKAISYTMDIQTWTEQRDFLVAAVAALPKRSRLVVAIERELEKVNPPQHQVHERTSIEGDANPFDPTGYTIVPIEAAVYPRVWGCGKHVENWAHDDKVHISFGRDGSIVHLRRGTLTSADETWATPDQRLAQVLYQGLSYDQMKSFTVDYAAGANSCEWNFGKPNMDKTEGTNATSNTPILTDFGFRDDGQSTTFLLTMRFPDSISTESPVRGAPPLLKAVVKVPHGSSNATGASVEYNLRWYNKSAAHAAESIWLTNMPATTDANGWRLEKLGALINPRDADLSDAVVDSVCTYPGKTCGVHLHAVGGGGVRYSTPKADASPAFFNIEPLDTALVSVGDPIATPTPLIAPDTAGGMHFSLYNNLWNTNYPTWYPFLPSDKLYSQFRFKFVFS